MGLSACQRIVLSMICLWSLALVGSSLSPFWVVQEVGGLKGRYGLWYQCEETIDGGDSCRNDWTSSPLENFAVRFIALHVIASLATLIACGIMLDAVVQVIGDDESTKALGYLSQFVGLQGFAAMIVFLSDTGEAMHLDDVSRGDDGWAVGLFGSSSIFLLIFGIIQTQKANAEGTLSPDCCCEDDD